MLYLKAILITIARVLIASPERLLVLSRILFVWGGTQIALSAYANIAILVLSTANNLRYHTIIGSSHLHSQSPSIETVLPFKWLASITPQTTSEFLFSLALILNAWLIKLTYWWIYRWIHK